MSYLDEQKRAENAASFLLEILEKPTQFNQLFQTYGQADGLIDNDFLALIPLARSIWKGIDDKEKAVELLALPLSFREAIFYGLLRDRKVDILHHCLKNTDDKAVVKRLKRLLFELKQNGFDVSEEKRKPALFRKMEQEPIETFPCFISAADANNERLLIVNEAGRNSVRTLQIYERNGNQIVQFRYDETSRKQLRKFVDELKSTRSLPIYLIETQFAHFVLQRLRAKAEQEGNAEPSGFVQAVSRMQLPTDIPADHPYRESIDADLVHERLANLANTEQLHKNPMFSAWLCDRHALMALQVSLQDLDASGLVIDETQRQEQIESRIKRAVDNFFTDKRAVVYTERLRDAAYLLRRDDYPEEAISAAALALALDDPKREPGSIPFFRFMLLKLIALSESHKKNDQTDGGLIV